MRNWLRATGPVRWVATLLVTMSLALSSQYAWTRTYTAAGGPGGTPDFAGNPPDGSDCSGCHRVECTSTLRVLDSSNNPVQGSYVPGQKYNWVVELSTSDDLLNRWGYELTIMWDCATPALQNKTAGTLAPSDAYSNLKPSTDGNRQFLTHYGVRAGDSHVDGTYGGTNYTVRWPFSWTAPAKTDPPCPVKIYATGVVANGDSLGAGDQACVISTPLAVDNPTESRRSSWGSLKAVYRNIYR
ncbi:MAG: hypothetical protein HW404_2083 [Anaerolineales bacterium]|nr:hypothetical protein [Anaerolineales bacterium]